MKPLIIYVSLVTGKIIKTLARTDTFSKILQSWEKKKKIELTRIYEFLVAGKIVKT